MGNMIFGPASYITMPQFASEFFKYGREANSADLGGSESSHPPEFVDVVRKVCKNGAKKLVVRRTTNFEVDEHTFARIISITLCDQVPV